MAIREFPKRKKTNAQGAVPMAIASRIWKRVELNLPMESNVDLMRPAPDYIRFLTTRFEFRAVTAVYSATFRQDLLLQIINPYRI